jgi:hypothetical protein
VEPDIEFIKEDTIHLINHPDSFPLFLDKHVYEYVVRVPLLSLDNKLYFFRNTFKQFKILTALFYSNEVS